MQSGTRAVLVTVLVGILLATAGCMDAGQEADGPETDSPISTTQDEERDTPDASAIQADAVAAMEGIETAHMTRYTNISDGNQTGTVVFVDAAFNLTGERMRMNFTTTYPAEQEFSTYTIGNTEYLKVDSPFGDGTQWTRQNASADGEWAAEVGEVRAHRDMLEGASVEVNGTDEVDGHEVWVLSIRPDVGNLSAINDGPGAGDIQAAFDTGDVEITQYVDTDTHHLRRTVARVNTTQDGQAVTMTSTTTFRKLDEPVTTIELPTAAENASSSRFGSGDNASAGDLFG